MVLCHTVAWADVKSAPARKGLGRPGAAGSASLELFLQCQAPIQPGSIRQTHCAPRIIARPQATLLGKQEVSLSPFHLWSFSHQELLFMAVSGSLHFMDSLTKFSAGSGSFLEVKTPYNSKHNISEHSRSTDFSVSWS